MGKFSLPLFSHRDKSVESQDNKTQNDAMMLSGVISQAKIENFDG